MSKKFRNAFGRRSQTTFNRNRENITKALDEYEHRKNKRKTDPPLDTSQLK